MLDKRRDKFCFAGHDLSDLVMVRVQRPVMAPVEVGVQEVVGAPGAFASAPRLTSYSLPVELWLRVEDRRAVAAARHRLAACLYSAEPAPLVLPDDPERYLLAVVEGQTDLGVISDELPHCTVTFRVTDPVAYGAMRTATLGTTLKQVDAGGTWQAFPVLHAVPPANTNSFTITDKTSGKAFTVAGIFDGTSDLTVHMDTERALYKGNQLEIAPYSEAISIEGVHELKVSSGTATLDWRERWL